MSSKLFAKRLILINRDFQLRYVGTAVVLGFITTLISCVLILYPLYQFEILKIPRFLPTPILAVIAAAALLNIAIIAVFGIYITHRIAGPMFAIVRAFRHVELGHWRTHLRVRSGDDLLYLVRNFNEMVDGIIRTTNEDIDFLKGLQASGENAGLKASLNELEIRMQKRIENHKGQEGKPA